MRVYVDGVWDMFHVGHLECLRHARALADTNAPSELIVGVVSDEDAASYKRTPIISHNERCEIVSALKIVSRIIPACPLLVTRKFLEDEGIDKVVHGFANTRDRDNQAAFFASIGDAFTEIPYTKGISTSELMQRILSRS